ncbi:MAG: hypothetical protein IIA33_11540 [Planctomycetes bacterium]|nr:hypothetical protein [Planctomycetota bacterium]
MPRNIGYPVKSRSVAVGKSFPARTRTVRTMSTGSDTAKPTQHGKTNDGKPPKKGVLTSGGAHG